MSYELRKDIDKVEWEDHFMYKDSRIKWIYTREKDGSPITVMLIELAKGITLPDHRHQDQPDLIYPIQGKATMYIEGEGEFPLRPGLVIMVLAFSLLSYFPLKNFLFTHPETGETGILGDYNHDHEH